MLCVVKKESKESKDRVNGYQSFFLLSVFISSISQILLKKSAGQSYKDRFHEYFNVYVIFAYGIFFVSSLMTVLAYRGVPLSVGPILEASGYVWVAVLSRIFLKEQVNKKKIAGLLLIILGICLSV